MPKEAFNVRGFHESIRSDFVLGRLSLEESATEFFKGGWTNYVDLEYAKKHIVADAAFEAVDSLRRQLDHLQRKVAHGCTDANCSICD